MPDCQRMLPLVVCFLLIMCWFPTTSLAVDETVLTVTASSGAKLRTLLNGNPQTARANLILLTGGNGVLKISGKGQIKKPSDNFLVRSRLLFARAGFLTALVDAPMDRRKKPGLLAGFRASKAHAADLAKVVKALYALNSKPVIVIGTSRGSVSALNIAQRVHTANLRAAVLTASITKRNKRGKTINDIPLHGIKIPLLFVHNKKDKCKVTPLKGVRRSIDRLKKSRVGTDLIVVTSQDSKGRSCGGLSPHGFLGIEKPVVKKIIQWINGL